MFDMMMGLHQFRRLQLWDFQRRGSLFLSICRCLHQTSIDIDEMRFCSRPTLRRFLGSTQDFVHEGGYVLHTKLAKLECLNNSSCGFSADAWPIVEVSVHVEALVVDLCHPVSGA